MEISTEIESGFMDTPLPVVKLNDHAVKFWIPWWEWERVRNALNQAIEDYPEYVKRAGGE